MLSPSDNYNEVWRDNASVIPKLMFGKKSLDNVVNAFREVIKSIDNIDFSYIRNIDISCFLSHPP